MLRRSTLREIKSSIARYLAIFSIVALGVGFFSGLKLCKSCMFAAGREYLETNNLYDYQIVSPYGIDDESVEMALKTDGVEDAEPSKQVDVLAVSNDSEENLAILKCISLPERINTVGLIEGRMPESDDECLIDDRTFPETYTIGDTVQLSVTNDEDTLDTFKVKKFKIVGTVSSPLYLDYQRGSTSLGNGSLDSYFYVKEDAFDTDYYTSLYVQLEGDEAVLSEEDENKLEKYKDSMEKLAEAIATARRDTAREEAQNTLNEKKNDYYKSLREFNRKKTSTYSNIRNSQKAINTSKTTIAEKRSEFNTTKASLIASRDGLQSQLDGVNEDIDRCEQSGEEFSGELAALITRQGGLQNSISYYNGLIADIDAGLDELDANERALDKGSKDLADGKKKADSEFAKAEKTLDDAKAQLEDAQKTIDEMDTVESYALSKEENSGYSTFDSNCSIVENIAKVFPVFFFLVAALVCMTTMTRMVDEQRTQIGVLKALGYSNKAILGKYLFYSGSGAMLGAVFGFFVGCKVFPTVIWNAYTMMYSFSDTVPFVFDAKLLIISLIATMICSMGATWVSISMDLRNSPANLIRPKTPKAGKRILLERIQPIWNRLSFLYKVSLRNIFRYKKRFFMMILGISGCTALLIAGIGINTTISRVAEYQYGEVCLYDYQIMFNKDMTDERQSDFIEYAEDETGEEFDNVLFVHSVASDLYNDNTKLEATCIVAEGDNFDKYINMHDGSRKIDYPEDGECVISTKVMRDLGVKVGDTISFKEDYHSMTVKVADACEYYVGDVIFMNPTTYTEGMGTELEKKTAFIVAPQGADEGEIRETATIAGQYDDAAAVVVNIDTLDMVSKMMESLKAVVFVVILCAGILAFIVLFNLTNINITERIREIATIKVLGFTQKETSQYVFRENVFLTGISALVGIPLGELLLKFVIDSIVVQGIYFQARLNPIDYVIAIVLTFIFAFIVSLAMQKRLRDVSMTESLKSIE